MQRCLTPLLVFVISIASCDGSSRLAAAPQACFDPAPLTQAEVERIIAQAVARAEADGEAYTVTVVSRDGVVAGAFRMAGAAAGFEGSCRAKARTAAFLSSNQHAFSTRTARFIIQDHFPPGVENTPGGPLYGVGFSSLACSDVVGETNGTVSTNGNGLSGDFGSMPLYRGNCLVGGVAVDGGPDDFDEERAAWAASAGFRPQPNIFGSLVFIDGIAVEFVEAMPEDIDPVPPYAGLAGTEIVPPADAPGPPAFPVLFLGGLSCELRYPIIGSPGAQAVKLDALEVRSILAAAAARSDRLRAAIRRPLGTAMRCFVAVVDVEGTVLGCIRTPDATLFSFDVAIQKARTAAFFSSDDAAFTTRGLGFLAQGFFPPGIDGTAPGPLHGLQDALNPACAPLALPLPNGITIFPGGVPLYKGGVLVGAIGVSGDGVDQDDFVASAGGELFPPPAGVRGDELSEAFAIAQLDARLDDIVAAAVDPAIVDAANEAKARLDQDGLQGVRLPYVKFPRQPYR